MRAKLTETFYFLWGVTIVIGLVGISMIALYFFAKIFKALFELL